MTVKEKKKEKLWRKIRLEVERNNHFGSVEVTRLSYKVWPKANSRMGGGKSIDSFENKYTISLRFYKIKSHFPFFYINIYFITNLKYQNLFGIDF